MVTAVERPLVAVETVPEQRIVLRGVSWDTYERLLDDLGDRRAPRLSSDRGELEIVAPSIEHERDTWRLETIV